MKPVSSVKAFSFILLLAALWLFPEGIRGFAAETEDGEYEAVAEEYIKGYLGAHPLEGTALGLHEYDGKITDYSRLALDAELSRLRRFDDRLSKFDPGKLSPRQSIDLRILQTAVKKDIFEMQDMSVFERNPMVYARAADVNVYIKRNFAPLEDRVRSLVAIESQIPNILIAARTNLNDVVPKPYVELAIQIARGSADFLKKDLVSAVGNLKDEQLRVAFHEANRKAANALNDYAAWLEREKLPKASLDFALGEEKFRRFLTQTELVDLPPQKILEIGMAQLKAEQEAFAEAAKKIDPNKSPIEVFKQIQSEHPTPQNLIPDVAKDLDKIRKYVLTRRLVSIPSDVRAKVKETPQYLRATSFASMDTPGPFEKRANEAYYYVTPTENDWPEKQKEEWLTAFNYYTSDVVSIHEAYPGHYVQFLCLNASPASKVEKIFGSYAFVEGWAHYCEKMMLDEGYGSSASSTPSEDDVKRAAKYRMAQADEALAPSLPVMCVDQDAHAEDVARRGNQVFSGELLLRRKNGAPGSHARHLRSRLSQLYPGQIADFEVARRLQSPAGRRFLTPKIPQRAAQSRYATHSSPSRNHAQRPEQMGPSPLIFFLFRLPP